MSLTRRILAALIAGLVFGIAIARFGGGLREPVLSVAQTGGTVWVG